MSGYSAIRSRIRDRLARNQNNMSEWTVISVSWHYKDAIKRVGLVQHHHYIECNLYMYIAEKCSFGVRRQSLTTSLEFEQ